MAQRVVRQLLDDLDESPATQTVSFALDGKTYAIDLNDAHAAELRGLMKVYVDAGRKAGVQRGAAGRRVDDFDPAAVRAWAASNGIQVSKRGRVPGAVVAQYKAAGYV
ncbi:MAG: Lsr2 family protein [Bifidobacteriaceae bacterium]|jgi:hypothetical protein|nr:Lsr2 family protein [Bifidobacteriaceae bacterium]